MKPTAPQRRKSTGSFVEQLETRIAPASIVVTTLADSGPGSLRQAVLDANAGLTITDNAAVTDCGGLGIFGGPVAVTISKSLIARNFAATGGGGLGVFQATANLVSTIVTGNVAKTQSGGLYAGTAATITVAPTSKVAGNIAPLNPNKNF